MKILVVGAGGREHALVWKLHQSPMGKEILCAPGNPGTAEIARSVPIDPASILELASFAAANRVDLTVIGPEIPLALGAADEFEKRGLKVFGARRAAAEIESSKIFAKEFMLRHSIPTAPFTVHDDPEDARRAIGARRRFPVVIKADGLAAGKGVLIAGSREEALSAIDLCMEEKRFGPAGERILIEDFLRGQETSFFALTDGERLLPLATCCDYKAVWEGDRGPNTGGMGSFSPSPLPDQKTCRWIMDRILAPTVAGLARESRPYRGILYAGLMLTEAGPKVLEFNARFGDPETQVLLPRMKSDLLPLLLDCAGGSLEGKQVEWNREAAVCVVLASEGYPEKPLAGKIIEWRKGSEASPDLLFFHAGTQQDGDGTLRSAGGRVINVVGSGTDLREARARAYAGVEAVHFQGMHFRSDIALERTATAETSTG